VAWTYGISETTSAALRMILRTAAASGGGPGHDSLPALAAAWPSGPVLGEIPAPVLLTMALTWIDPLDQAAADPRRLAELTAMLGRLMRSDGDQQRRNTGRLLMATARTAECRHDVAAAAYSWDLVRDALLVTGGAVSDEARRLADGAVTRVLSGRVRDAVAETTRAQVLSEELGLTVTHAVATASRALAHAWAGDLSAVAADVSQARTTGVRGGPALTRAITGWAAGVAALRTHRYAEAWAELCRVGEHATIGRNAIADLVEAAVGTADRAHLAVAAARLAEAEHAAAVLGSAHLSALTLRGRALLQAADRDDDAVEALFQQAVAEGRGAAAPLELGRTLLAYGDWLRRRGRVIIARKYFGEAQFVFDSAGAAPWSRAAVEQLHAAGVVVGRTGGGPVTAGVLTAQERRVAELAATGLTTREVAGALRCSERTVTWYLAEVYPKLGVTGRWQLAEALDPGGAAG
jgi:DNA-binding CsgD family transcriptional regulator